VRLKKSEREQVCLKYGGRCAYCGVELGERWHADHFEPVVRNWGEAASCCGSLHERRGKRKPRSSGNPGAWHALRHR
jgi:hypothetical protein